MTRNRRYTTEDDRIIIEKWNNGESINSIARYMERQTGSVSGRLRLLREKDIVLRPSRRGRQRHDELSSYNKVWGFDEVMRLLDLYEAGAPRDFLAFKFGRTEKGIEAILGKARANSRIQIKEPDMSWDCKEKAVLNKGGNGDPAKDTKMLAVQSFMDCVERDARFLHDHAGGE